MFNTLRDIVAIAQDFGSVSAAVCTRHTLGDDESGLSTTDSARVLAMRNAAAGYLQFNHRVNTVVGLS